MTEKKGRKILAVYLRFPEGELTRLEVAENLGVEQRRINNAMACLYNGNLLLKRKEKISTPPYRKTIYRLNPAKMVAIRRLVKEDTQ